MEGEVGSRRSWRREGKVVVVSLVTKGYPQQALHRGMLALWVSRSNALKTNWWVGLDDSTNQNFLRAESAEHEKLQSVGFNQSTAHRMVARKFSSA